MKRQKKKKYYEFLFKAVHWVLTVKNYIHLHYIVVMVEILVENVSKPIKPSLISLEVIFGELKFIWSCDLFIHLQAQNVHDSMISL